MKKKILLISAYDATSHRYWREQLQTGFPEYDWTQLALPPRHFSWRVRGNPLSLSGHHRDSLTADYDLLITTSLTDVATLRGLFPNLARLPLLVYFHENQFAYPDNALQQQQLEACMVNLYSALAADCVAFNSQYNRQSFLDGVEQLINRLPDFTPKRLAATLAARSQIIPVPLEERLFTPPKTTRPNTLTVVWNHRWEYDKGPERLCAALQLLKQADIPFRLNLIGQRFRRQPAIFADMQRLLSDEIQYFGPVEGRAAYLQVLRESHLVISTALHEFQGLALQEAVASGCVPVAPERLVYPEYLGERFLYTSTPDDEAREARALADSLMAFAENFARGNLVTAPTLKQWAWSALRPEYAQLFQTLLASNTSAGRACRGQSAAPAGESG